MSLRRMFAILRKEILHILRDPRNLFLVTLSPAFLLFLLSYIFSFEVNQIRLAVLDLDRSALSRGYLANLTNDPDYVLSYTVDGKDEILGLLRGGDIDAGLVIPPGFAGEVNRGQPAHVQAIVDGTDPYIGAQAIGSMGTRSGIFVAGTPGALAQGGPVEARSLAWYNAGLESMVSMVPGLLAVVLIMPTLAFALALTREKETGTLEGLMATPVSGFEYLGGKLLAYVSASLVSAVLALVVAVLWFKVPFRGSLGVYLLLAALYFIACMGAAVVVASFVKSQQTAMYIVLLVFIVPSFFLAGLITPIGTDSLTTILTSYALPSTHFVEISRVLFLKGLGMPYVNRPALVLAGMGLGAMVIGLCLFKKKVS
jgi:ABC-2 type transport system permease protein